eukprot:c23026_g1_i2 orf=84-479(+)
MWWRIDLIMERKLEILQLCVVCLCLLSHARCRPVVGDVRNEAISSLGLRWYHSEPKEISTEQSHYGKLPPSAYYHFEMDYSSSNPTPKTSSTPKHGPVYYAKPVPAPPPHETTSHHLHRRHKKKNHTESIP